MNDQRNPEEREILEGFERGELRRIGGVEDEIESGRQAARATFRKTRNVSLWVTERDFDLAHVRAREEGVPYQILLSRIIHKYLSGRLIEKRWTTSGQRGPLTAPEPAVVAANELPDDGLPGCMTVVLPDPRPPAARSGIPLTGPCSSRPDQGRVPDPGR